MFEIKLICKRTGILLAAVILILFITSVAAEKDREPVNGMEGGGMMKQELDQLIKSESALQGAQIGISIRSADTGKKRYDHMGDVRLRPASNLKLITAAASLSVLGERHTFQTELHSDGQIKANKLIGNLYMKGGGDPTLLSENLDQFAKELRKRGITKIEGDIIGDDTRYDEVRLSKDLVWSDEHYHYGAQISALTASPDKDYDAGSVIVEVSPGEETGEKPNITITPKTDYIEIINKAETVTTEHDEEELIVERVHGENTIIVKGQIPLQSDPIKEWLAVWDPTRYALDLFTQALAANQISWNGEINSGKTPKKAERLLRHESKPVAELLIPFMKLSNNGIGEVLVKEMGKEVKDEGSWEAGLEVMEAAMHQLEINTDTLLFRDGSGISHVNMIPANEISRLLYNIQDKTWFDSYFQALPVAGDQKRMKGGTLQNRLSDIPVRAKTGTIDSVTSLSGYIETSDSEDAIFSIIINNMLDEEEGKDIEDKIVRIIHAYF